MPLIVRPESPIPIYQQIRDQVVEAIARGEASAGSTLPSIRQLALDLGVNLHTVNKGYNTLRGEGLVRINRKSGAVINRDASTGPPAPGFTPAWAGRLRTLLAEAAAQGMSQAEIRQQCEDVIDTFH